MKGMGGSSVSEATNVVALSASSQYIEYHAHHISLRSNWDANGRLFHTSQRFMLLMGGPNQDQKLAKCSELDLAGFLKIAGCSGNDTYRTL
jgi:hypothetical protein